MEIVYKVIINLMRTCNLITFRDERNYEKTLFVHHFQGYCFFPAKTVFCKINVQNTFLNKK